MSLLTRSALAAFLLAGAGSTAHAETLSDAISLAYQTNPNLLSQRAALRALDENYVQARAQAGPTVSVSGSGIYNNAQVDQGASIFSAATTVHDVAKTGTASVSVVQPLYTGGQIAANVNAAEAEILAGRQNLRGAETQVLQNVVLSYIGVRQDQQSLEVAQSNVAMLTQELQDTQARFKVREVTMTDEAQAEARLAGAQAQLANAQARLTISRSQYLQWVGQNPGDLAPEPDVPVPGTADEAFDLAEINSPSLLAAQFTERSSRDRVAQAKAANSASVSLRADYGVQPLAQYESGLYDKGLTAQVVVSKPIFNSGLNESRIRQALEQNNRDRLTIDSTRRQVIQSVAQAWSQLVAARKALAAQEEQVRANRIAYAGARAEQKIGLRTTIDVLNAEQELQSAELGVLQSRHDEYAARTTLLGAIGLLQTESIAPDVPRYDPVGSFRHVSRIGAVPWEGAVQKLDSVGSHTSKKVGPGPLEDARPVASPTLPPLPVPEPLDLGHDRS